MKRNRWLNASMLVLAIFMASLLAYPQAGWAKEKLVLSTGSPYELGLIDALAKPFEAKYNCKVDVMKAGSGKAIKLLRGGQVDVIMVHAKKAEEQLIRKGYGVNRRLVACNDFVIAGPKMDPAGIKGSKNAAKAYKKIAHSKSLFFSRADNSGTHKKEMAIWKKAGIKPKGKWYRTTGKFMGATLKEAGKKQGYFMTDRSTYIYLSKEVDLDILFEGDPTLVNHYHAIAVNPAKYPERNYEMAVTFIGFITSPAGQKIIRDYGKKEFGTALYIALAIPCDQAAEEPSGILTIFHAGSLSVPFASMEKAFETKYPGVDVQREGAGSQRCARKISDLKKPCDIMASADYKIIDKLLVPEYANWNIRFATNQLVLCYTDKSRYAKKVNAKDWYEILCKKGVVWGHSDPNLDPCGYRSLMVLQLAEKYYKKPGLYDELISNRPKENIRPKSVELVSLLQTGNMDYAWEYLSVAVQHGLRYIVLPDEINLGNYKFDDLYGQAVVKVTGKKPGTYMDIKGKSVTYGVTLITGAPNREAAIVFLQYMLHPQEGLKILKEMGQPPFIPCRVPTKEMKAMLPAELQQIVEVKN